MPKASRTGATALGTRFSRRNESRSEVAGGERKPGRRTLRSGAFLPSWGVRTPRRSAGTCNAQKPQDSNLPASRTCASSPASAGSSGYRRPRSWRLLCTGRCSRSEKPSPRHGPEREWRFLNSPKAHLMGSRHLRVRERSWNPICLRGAKYQGPRAGLPKTPTTGC